MAERRGPRSKRDVAQYTFEDEAFTELLLATVIGMALKGGAMRIGLTRDGGALAIGMYLGDDYSTEYIRPTENPIYALREIQAAWEVFPAVYDDVAGRWLAT